ncbi:hypothetical protein [Denitratimonas sp. CY0512]|uniref:hypothetical protein n=1 Tax=Denitratimonas sp. CY0512 TaxID=3131940 RepID=UPI0030A3E265
MTTQTLMQHQIQCAVALALLMGCQSCFASGKLAIRNVDPIHGATETTQVDIGGVKRAAVPIVSPIEHAEDGHVYVDCVLDSDGECPGIGVASSLSPATITITAPLGDVPAGDIASRLTWTAIPSEECWGSRSQPSVSGWNRAWPATTNPANGFQVGNLPRHPTNPTHYDFTLQCYSSPIPEPGSVDSWTGVMTEITHRVTLAPSG